MDVQAPILVTGAAGRVGSVGRTVVELLCRSDRPVRALVRVDDERAATLRGLGAEVVVGDLTRPEDVSRAMAGCRRVYFGMSVSPLYLEATVIAAAVAREQNNLEVLVNISQLTASQMSLTHMTDSSQQRQHWLADQVVNWSAVPFVNVRPTVFLENPLFFDLPIQSIARDNTLRLPFGTGRSSPIAARDVARVVATILQEPTRHIGQVYELTGARSETMHAVADEFSAALGRRISYADVPYEAWRDNDLSTLHLPKHVFEHICTMALLHAQNRYDRSTDHVQVVTGKAPSSVRDFVAGYAARYLSDSVRQRQVGR